MPRKQKLTQSAKRSFAVIILKGFANKIREEYPTWRVEGHPMTDNSATLFVTRRDVDHSVKFTLSKRYGSAIETEIIVFYQITFNGKLKSWKRRGKYPTPNNSINLNLQEPDSLHKLEEWIFEKIRHIEQDKPEDLE